VVGHVLYDIVTVVTLERPNTRGLEEFGHAKPRVPFGVDRSVRGPLDGFGEVKFVR